MNGRAEEVRHFNDWLAAQPHRHKIGAAAGPTRAI